MRFHFDNLNILLGSFISSFIGLVVVVKTLIQMPKTFPIDNTTLARKGCFSTPTKRGTNRQFVSLVIIFIVPVFIGRGPDAIIKALPS